jgi:hypothetical protein
MTTVYLASPLGFSPEWKSYRDKIKRRLYELGCTVSDPWEQPFRPTIEEASTIADWPARVAAFKAIAAQIGKANENMIRSCDAVLGVLDGPELDSVPSVKLLLVRVSARDATDCGPISGTAETLRDSRSTCRCCTGSSPAAGGCSGGLRKSPSSWALSPETRFVL